MTTLRDVKEANSGWFSLANKRFFNDVAYRVLHGKISKKPYLVRSTYAWSDMFGQEKKLHYRINIIKDDLEIGSLTDDMFSSNQNVKDWLGRN